MCGAAAVSIWFGLRMTTNRFVPHDVELPGLTEKGDWQRLPAPNYKVGRCGDIDHNKRSQTRTEVQPGAIARPNGPEIQTSPRDPVLGAHFRR
jgi:hypothetical protein